MIRSSMNKSLNDVDFTKRNGLLPVVVQDKNTKDILTLAYANREALENTIRTRNPGFWVSYRIK